MKNLFSKFRRALPLLTLLFLLPSAVWGAETPSWTYKFVDANVKLTNNQFKVNGATWIIAGTVGTGTPSLPTASTKNAYNKKDYYNLKFGESGKSYFSTITFTTDYFSDKLVSRVEMRIRNNGSQAGTITVKQNNVQIGTQTFTASNSWTTYYADCTNSTGGTLEIAYSVAQACYVEQITVYYAAGAGPTKLSAPENPTSSDVTANSATLSWDAVANASSYTVKIGDTEHTGITGTSYSATGLTSNTTYNWTVKAVGDGTNYTTSDDATPVPFTTLAPSTAHTVTFNVGTNGAFKDGEEFVNENQRVEASAGAGVPLPEVVANTGYVFGGWSAADSATSTYVAVGDDGKYHPADNETLNAYYKVIPAAPTFNVEAGQVEKGTEVTISCTTEGATIYYTTNGDNPTSSSSVYSSAIALTTGQTIKAVAIKEDVSSSVAEATYTIATHTAKFSINGIIDETKNSTVAKGEAISFPSNPADIDDLKFQGWTKTQNYSNATDAPSDLCTSATIETEDVTFYAVYANGEEGEPTLTKLGSNATFAAGDKIVIIAKDVVDGVTSYYGMYHETVSTSWVNYFKLTSAPTVSDIDDVKKYWILSVGSADATWHLGDATDGYLYNSSNNMYSNGNIEQANNYTIAWNTNNSAFTIKQGTRWVACRSELTGDNQYRYRGAGTSAEPAKTNEGVYSIGYLDIYKYAAGEPTYSNYCTNVVVREISNIAVKTAPTTVNYCEGEKFNPAGLEITVNYTEGDPEDVTYAGNETKFSFSPNLDAELVTANEQVTITYKDKNCQQAINVRAVSISAPTTVEGTYTVKVGDADAVTADGNTIAAKKGQKIVLASKAAEGYRPQGTPFVVKDENDGDVKVSKSGDTYSFDMPDKDVTITAKFSKLYTLTAAETTNGSITIKWSGTVVTEAVKGNKIVIDVTPNTHYTLGSLYYVKEGEETQNTINKTDDVYSFLMEDANTTIYATFAEDEKHEAIFYVNGKESSRAYVYTGENVVFPETNPEDQGGKVFMGWASEQIGGTQAEAPAFANETGVLMAQSDIPFYAVFASERGTKSTDYSKITSMDALTDGNYVIAYDYNSGTQIAMKNVAKTNNTQLAAANLSLSNSKYVKPSAEYIWNVKKVIDGDNTYYTIYNADAGKYVKAISSGVSLVDDAYNFTITWDNSNKCYRIQSTTNTTYYLHGFVSGSSYDFRSSTSGSGANYHLHLYRNESTVEYYAYCTTIPNIDVTLSVSGTAGYGTFIAPYDVVLPEGLVAYTATAATETTVTMEEMELTSRLLPAGTPVVLKNATGTTISETYNAYPTTMKTTSENNLLVGSYELHVVPGNTYLLQYKNGVVSFNHVAAGNTTLTIGVNRCYLQLPDAVGTPERLVLVLPNSPIATDVEAVNKYVDTKKMLVHGQLVIVRGNKMFDMNGRLVK